jgi:signal peptidase I
MNNPGKLAINAVAIAVIAAIAVKHFLMEVVVIDSNAMAPTLIFGDQVLAWKGASPDFANIMICDHPYKEHQRVMGRVIAFPGAKITTNHHGQLFVNGDRAATGSCVPLQFRDRPRKMHRNMYICEINYFGKRDHQYFVEEKDKLYLDAFEVDKGIYLLGDNRSEVDYDSRAFGEVDPKTCDLQIFMRLKPSRDTPDELGHSRLEFLR